AADSPAMFTRTVVPQVHPGTAWNSALYAGDTWRVGGGLRLTYGARLEAARFSGAPLHNRAVDSLFGVRTDRIPSEVHVSPRHRGDPDSHSERDGLRPRLRRAPRPARVTRAAAPVRQQ